MPPLNWRFAFRFAFDCVVEINAMHHLALSGRFSRDLFVEHAVHETRPHDESYNSDSEWMTVVDVCGCLADAHGNTVRIDRSRLSGRHFNHALVQWSFGAPRGPSVWPNGTPVTTNWRDFRKRSAKGEQISSALSSGLHCILISFDVAIGFILLVYEWGVIELDWLHGAEVAEESWQPTIIYFICEQSKSSKLQRRSFIERQASGRTHCSAIFFPHQLDFEWLIHLSVTLILMESSTLCHSDAPKRTISHRTRQPLEYLIA